jgi:lipopolysaccharide/colanic/teichoic acid biosynthesis glycosyltransferase
MRDLAKGALDRLAALLGLVVLAPLLSAVLLLVWLQDRRSPLYIADRAGRGGIPFRMMKIRSMVANADRLGAASTAGDDQRITAIGRFIRRWKLDELSQLWNVLKGDMSLVGPRPQVMSEVETYTAVERGLLAAKPGITDFSSIVFADEAEILFRTADADLAYRQLIRPWKSRLGLFYVENHSMGLDLQLIALTLVRIVAPDRALVGVSQILRKLGAPEELICVARRTMPLVPHAVPGMSKPF